MSLRSLFFVLFSMSLCACTGSSSSNPPSGQPEEALIKRGAAVYMANCTACHNSNPKMAGSVGPDIYGSSRELIEARILRQAYPDGYKPKRSTHVMPALQQLQGDIPALHAYLNAH